MAMVLWLTDSGEEIGKNRRNNRRMRPDELPVLPPDVNESLGDFAVVSIKEKDKEN